MSRFDEVELRKALSDVQDIVRTTGLPPQIPLPDEVMDCVRRRERVNFPYDFSEEKFARVWPHGVPFVVIGVGNKLQLGWSPEYFKQNYGHILCDVEETTTSERQEVSVAEFFTSFGHYDVSRPVQRLKVCHQQQDRF